jgi:hypothetical protein
MTGPAMVGCARPGCPNIVHRNRRGRPRLYCSPACRDATHRRRHPDERAPITIEIDHHDVGTGRPTGHVWLVRLRRGTRHTVIADELGRTTAEYLATQIREVINPRAD